MALQTKQRDLIRLLNRDDNVLAFGGARSGKTYAILYWMIVRGYRHAGCRQLVARRYASDIRASIWRDTLPKVLGDMDMHPGEDYEALESIAQITFENGSTITCAGLDDKERVDKILGQEYVTEYMNESQDIPWPTVKTLRTRLSQKIEGAGTRFIADLNPGSTAHWTYKLFIARTHPESGEPVSGAFSSIQINPHDNEMNLAPGYIERELDTLTGDFRSRFLLGEYAVNTGLSVFSPPDFYAWSEFLEWGAGLDRDGIQITPRWPDVRLVAGLDLGVDDPDAFVVLAYRDGDPDVWIVYEHMARRQSTEELAAEIKRGMTWTATNIPTPEPTMDIWSDTNTVRHGREGDSKKNARMLAEIYGLPCRAAYKRDKMLGIEFLRDDVNAGRLHIPRGGAFAEECTKTVWTKNHVDETIIREIDDEVFHPNAMDAILYAYRYLMSYGNSAMIGRAAKGSKEPEQDFTARMSEALDQSSRVW